MMQQHHFMLTLQKAGSIQSQKGEGGEERRRREEKRVEWQTATKQTCHRVSRLTAGNIAARFALQRYLRYASVVQQQPLRGTFIPPALSDLNAVASEQATGNWQQATCQQPLACIRIRNYDALTF